MISLSTLVFVTTLLLIVPVVGKNIFPILAAPFPQIFPSC